MIKSFKPIRVYVYETDELAQRITKWQWFRIWYRCVILRHRTVNACFRCFYLRNKPLP